MAELKENLIELTHFIHPSWKYEECEDYIFDNK